MAVTDNELTANSLDNNQETLIPDEKLTISKKKNHMKKHDSVVVTESESSSKSHEENPETLPELDMQQVDTVDDNSVMASENELTASCLDDLFRRSSML